MSVDLHTHTTASDGELSPSDLLVRAQHAGVSLLAITDHDTLDGVREAQAIVRGEAKTLTLVNGIEISAQWGNSAIHIVGLNFDIDNDALLQFVSRQKKLRAERNEKILQRLEKQGVGSVREQLASQGLEPAHVGRPQIAAALVQLGVVANTKKAFKRFLGAGGSATAALNWPPVRDAAAIINGAGGDAVLAHPLHYRLTATRLRALLTDFKAAGGSAIEVLSAGQNAEQSKQLASLARRFSLKASQGSDFHTAQAPWQALGKLDQLPDRCEPVWAEWQEFGKLEQGRAGGQQ